MFHSTSVIARHQAARSGLGIAVLPCFMAAGDPDLVALLPGEGIQRSYWISSRRELHKSVRLRVLWDYVVELCAREQGLLLGETSLTKPA